MALLTIPGFRRDNSDQRTSELFRSDLGPRGRGWGGAMSIWRVVAVFGEAPAAIFLLVTAAAYAPA